MQTSIFDLPLNSTIADLPVAIVEPKPENWYVVADKPTAAPRASPMFAIGEIVQSDRYFKRLAGEIIGLEQFGDVDFAIVRYQWHGSVIDYPAIATSLTAIGKTPLLEVALPVDNTQLTVDNQQPPVENQQLQIGDRVKVLEHEFMCDRVGTIQKLEGEMAIVNFGANENIWCIYIGRLQDVRLTD